MRQLVYRDKNTDGKERTFTTTKSGKMLFPHRECKIEFDSITIIDDFKIVYEKERYGFFTGKKIEICLPSYEELAEHDMMPLSTGSILIADNYYVTSHTDWGNITTNTFITKDATSGEIISISEEKQRGKVDNVFRYYALFNATNPIAKKMSIGDFIFLSCVSRDRQLTDVQRAQLAYTYSGYTTHPNRDTYYDKCVISIKHKLIEVRFISYIGAVQFLISHDVLLKAIKEKYIHIVGKQVYKDSITECFKSGFGHLDPHARLMALPEEVKSLDCIKGFIFPIYHTINTYIGRIYVMDIMQYDKIKDALTEEEIELLHSITKNCLKEVGHDIDYASALLDDVAPVRI